MIRSGIVTGRFALGLLLLVAACGGETEEERVQRVPREPEASVAEAVEAGTEAEGVDEEGVEEAVAADTGEGEPSGFAAVVALGSPPTLGYNARQGEALFAHYCSVCHGALGRGDGFNSYSLDPKPRDLTDPQLQAQRSDEELAAVIRAGGGAAGLSTGMPPWGRTLGELQIRNLVLYVRLLPELAEAENG